MKYHLHKWSKKVQPGAAGPRKRSRLSEAPGGLTLTPSARPVLDDSGISAPGPSRLGAETGATPGTIPKICDLSMSSGLSGEILAVVPG